MAQDPGYWSSSSEAVQSFKTKITDSLSLLQYMTEEDKDDVWTFWKTVSSAIKIAVNGKGDVAPVTKRTKSLEWQNRGFSSNELGVEDLDKSIERQEINLPPKTSNCTAGKYRVLQVIDEKTITDYEIPISMDDDIEEKAKENCTGDNLFVTDNSTLKTTSCPENVLSQTDSSATHLENIQQEESLSYECNRKHNQSNRKAVIWPVTRPATRSVSKNQGLINSSKEFTTQETIEGSGLCSFKDPSLPNSRLVRSEGQLHNENSVDKGKYSVTFFKVGGIDLMQVIKENEGDRRVDVTCSSSDSELGKDQNENDNHPSVQELTVSERLLENKDGHFHERQETAGPQTVETLNTQSISNTHPIENHVTPADNPIVQIKIEEPVIQSESQTGLEIKHNVQEMDHQGISVQDDLANRSTSDIETIISALEAELKKNGKDVGSLPISSRKEEHGEGATTASNDQVVQFMPGQEIVEIQNGQEVIWTSTGEVQVAGAQAMMVADGNSLEEGAMGPQIDARYDVVEYEVFADKEKVSGNGGRKKKAKNVGQDKDFLDRTCPMCHRVLTYASSMAAHMRIHTGDRPYSCGQCDRKFTTKANRDRHEATHVGLKPFKCTECGKSFTEKRSLKIHMRTHTGERPFVCTICDQGFAQKCTLLVHMDRHTNRKGHLCDLCGKAFRQKCQLDIHVKRHKRLANFPCTQCSIKCYTKGDLMRHMIKHTGERPFQCNLCSRTFTRKQYLIDHENTHYGRKPYKCSICSQAFHDMGSCHRHLRKHRQEEEEENGGKKSQKITSLFSTEDFNVILKGSESGQVLTLEDGTKALIKAVESEADGSVVYHISCVGTDVVDPDGDADIKCEEMDVTDFHSLNKTENVLNPMEETPSV